MDSQSSGGRSSRSPALGAGAVRRALVVGLVHAAVVVALAVRLRGFVPDDPFLLAYALGGAVVVAAVPVVLLGWRGLASPSLVVLALLAAAAYANWSTYVAPSPPPTPVGPTVLGWYLLGWPAVLAAALAAGAGERAVRGLWQRSTGSNAG
jgi:energy-coupling factor transporter transmembrane protein EcfT